MRYADLPERWKTKLREYLLARGNTRYATPGAGDFPADGLVRIGFEDDSRAEFRHAFLLIAPELDEVAVFTEHCGYHLFRWYDGMNLVVETGTDNSGKAD